VDLADLVGTAGVVEDPLGRRGLARIDVGHDPDVPNAIERDGCFFSLVLKMCVLSLSRYQR
jgi:hypothetical protein